MRPEQSQRQSVRQAANNAAQSMNATMESANVQEQVTKLRKTLEEEKNDDRPRLWVLPEDVPGHDKSGVIKDAVQEACPGYLVQVAVNTTDGGVDEENIHAALFGAATGDLEESEDDEGHWRFCDGVADPKAPAGSDGKLALEQHTETGEYRTRPYGEVVDAD